MTWGVILLIYHLNITGSSRFATDSIKRAESKYSLLPNGAFILTRYFSWGHLFLAADKKILFQICAVPRPPHAVTSPLPLTLFPYNRIPHINGGLVRLTKAYHHKAPFHSSFQLDLWTSHAAPRLRRSLVCVCGRGRSAEWICVWRWQKTCLVTTGFGDVCSIVCGWCCVCVCFDEVYSGSWQCAQIEWLLRVCICRLAISHGFICTICTVSQTCQSIVLVPGFLLL